MNDDRELSGREVALVQAVLNFVNEMPGATISDEMIQAQFKEDMELVSVMKYVATDREPEKPLKAAPGFGSMMPGMFYQLSDGTWINLTKIAMVSPWNAVNPTVKIHLSGGAVVEIPRESVNVEIIIGWLKTNRVSHKDVNSNAD